MRTKEEILTDINAEADKHTELSELQANTSKVAFWKAIKEVVAFAILTVETLFERHLNEVENLIKRTEPGTDDWYRELALKYQDGDTISVRNNLTVYPQEDESKRIIKRVSIRDNENGGIIMKVAKEDAGFLSPLDRDEKTRFEVYMSRVKFAGTRIEVVSLTANLLWLNMTIEVDALLFDVEPTDNVDAITRIDDGSNPIKTALQEYLYNYSFDSPFYLSKLIDAIQSVEGVKDVSVHEASLGNMPIWRKIDEVPSGYFYLKENSKIYFKF